MMDSQEDFCPTRSYLKSFHTGLSLVLFQWHQVNL